MTLVVISGERVKKIDISIWYNLLFQVCAGLRKKGRKWVRAKVMCVLQTTRGLSAKLVLILCYMQ